MLFQPDLSMLGTRESAIIIANGDKVDPLDIAPTAARYHMVENLEVTSDLEVERLKNRIISDPTLRKITFNVHGGGGFIFLTKKPIHPSELALSDKKIIYEIFACGLGHGLRYIDGTSTKDLDDTSELHRYLAIPENAIFLLHSGADDSMSMLISALKKQSLEETDEIKLMLESIINCPETAKFITKKDGKLYFHKYSAPKPKSPADLTRKGIRDFLFNEIDNFLEFSQDIDLIDEDKKTILSSQYKEKITGELIFGYRHKAFALEIARNGSESRAAYIEHYLNSDLDPSYKIEDYNPLLHFAITCNKFHAAEKLIDNSEYGSLNFTDDSYSSALHIAADMGDVEVVKKLLDKGLNPNLQVRSLSKNKERGIAGYTALHIATSRGHVATVQTLLNDPRIELNLRDFRGYTAAELTRNPEILKIFAEKKAAIMLPKISPIITSKPIESRMSHDRKQEERLRIIQEFSKNRMSAKYSLESLQKFDYDSFQVAAHLVSIDMLAILYSEPIKRSYDPYPNIFTESMNYLEGALAPAKHKLIQQNPDILHKVIEAMDDIVATAGYINLFKDLVKNGAKISNEFGEDITEEITKKLTENTIKKSAPPTISATSAITISSHPFFHR